MDTVQEDEIAPAIRLEIDARLTAIEEEHDLRLCSRSSPARGTGASRRPTATTTSASSMCGGATGICRSRPAAT